MEKVSGYANLIGVQGDVLFIHTGVEWKQCDLHRWRIAESVEQLGSVVLPRGNVQCAVLVGGRIVSGRNARRGEEADGTSVLEAWDADVSAVRREPLWSTVLQQEWPPAGLVAAGERVYGTHTGPLIEVTVATGVVRTVGLGNRPRSWATAYHSPTDRLAVVVDDGVLLVTGNS